MGPKRPPRMLCIRFQTYEFSSVRRLLPFATFAPLAGLALGPSLGTRVDFCSSSSLDGIRSLKLSDSSLRSYDRLLRSYLDIFINAITYGQNHGCYV